MKKILGFLISVILLVGCSQTEEEHAKNARQYVQRNSVIVELEHNGSIHEFVWFADGYQAGLAHWPDCKYCDEKTVKGEEK